MRLGIRQQGCLESLRDFGLWKTGYCRWGWGSPWTTHQIMLSLERHGLVQKSTEHGMNFEGIEIFFRLTDAGKAYLENKNDE